MAGRQGLLDARSRRGRCHHQPAGSGGACWASRSASSAGRPGGQPCVCSGRWTARIFHSHWAPHSGSQGGPAGRQLCVSPQLAPVLALGCSCLHRTPLRHRGERRPWSPGGAGCRSHAWLWGGPILSASLASLSPTPTDPVTPGPVSSRKATGLQGRPVCEPERLTGLPRARGSLLSGQAPAGPSCAASPDSCRPVNSWLQLLAGEIQCFCKNQKLLDFPIPCPVALRETQEAGPRSCEAFPPRHACLLQGRLRFLLGQAEAAGKSGLSVPCRRAPRGSAWARLGAGNVPVKPRSPWGSSGRVSTSGPISQGSAHFLCVGTVWAEAPPAPGPTTPRAVQPLPAPPPRADRLRRWTPTRWAQASLLLMPPSSPSPPPPESLVPV